MGSDFSTHKIFIEDKSIPEEFKNVERLLKEIMNKNGLEEVEKEDDADRSFVIISEKRWIHLGDSAGSSGYKSSDFKPLSEEISKYYPIVDIHVSDSAALNLYLYDKGIEIDRYGNREFPFYSFSNNEDASLYQGKSDLWKQFLLDPNKYNDLRKTWTQDILNEEYEHNDNEFHSTDEILSETAKYFGWNEPLYMCGYTEDLEGLCVKYNEILRVADRNYLNNFQYLKETHFRYKMLNINSTKTKDLSWYE